MTYEIENMLFWFGYYYSMFSPIVGLLVTIGLDSIILRKIYEVVIEKYNSMIEQGIYGN